MENNFVFDTWFEDVGISNAAHKLTVKNWLKEEALDTYEALKNFKPLTQCPTENFKLGWKNALQTSLDAAFPIDGRATAGGTDSSESMFSWLAKTSGENPLTAEEQVIFWTKFGGYTAPLRDKLLSIVDTRQLVKNVRTVLRSQTTKMMRSNGFVFDGILGQIGGGKALLYHVIEVETGEVKCGKVYRVDSETEATVSAEIHGSAAVHKDGTNLHIVCYEATVKFKHESTVYGNMVALIMPLYQISLADIIEAFFQTQLPEHMFLKVAHCVLGAGARFHELDRGHCDFKPENIMMTGTTFTVIDLGAVCNYNDQPRECTVGYYLDAPIHELTPIFDLNCAAVTLARCCISDFKVRRGMTRAHLLEITSREHASASVYSQVLKICLTANNCGEAYTLLLNIA